MAPSRQVRIQDEPAQDGDTDQDSEKGTPRPSRSNLKKRLSEIDPDGSFIGDPSRVPLKSVSLNDDAAEKRRRRKSAKIGLIEDLEMGENADDHENNPESRPPRQKQQINILPPPAQMDVPRDIMNSNFEEWMKMTTDNKINPANSWFNALIDYFADMKILRNDVDNSINFQRASSTLDGCVKIWTSRVDSVQAETGKLLSNLANQRDSHEDEDSDNPDADPTQIKKKRAHRPAATLVKDPVQLRTKKLDLEFYVDPLFKKTCADFDEGGAHGLLMNHLSLGVGSDALRIIFDASDSKRNEDEENVEEPVREIDISDLQREFFSNLDEFKDKKIAPSLVGFEFSGANTAFHAPSYTDPVIDDGEIDNVGGPPFEFGGDDFDGGDYNAAPVEDFFSGADAVNDDYGGGMGRDDYVGNSDPAVPSAGGDDGPATGPYIPFDPRNVPNQRDLVMAMADADENGALDYFDKNFMKNWAGPEHWKLRKVIRKPETNPNEAKAKRKEKKEAFKIDFFKPHDKDLKELTNELFAPVGKGQSINLPGTGAGRKGKKKTAEKKNDHRLPDDMHFSSRQLVKLFLKPKFELKMRGRRVKINEDGDGEVDVNFWAQAAADQANGRRGDEDEDADTNIPFNTQFFQDDYDDGPGFGPGFDDDGDGFGVPPDVDDEEQDLLLSTQNPMKRPSRQTVNYTKRAKRVDVRKLKDNIWKGLDIAVPQKRSEKHMVKDGDEDIYSDEEDGMDIDSEKPLTDPSEAHQFSQVIAGLQKTYPKDKMDEISTSFCFICLLHLANEQGLRLESNVGEDETVIYNTEEDPDAVGNDGGSGWKVGDIWNVNVYRDPDVILA